MLIAASAVGASIAGLLLYLRNRNNVQKTVNSISNDQASSTLNEQVRNTKYSMG